MITIWGVIFIEAWPPCDAVAAILEGGLSSALSRNCAASAKEPCGRCEGKAAAEVAGGGTRPPAYGNTRCDGAVVSDCTRFAVEHGDAPKLAWTSRGIYQSNSAAP